MVVAEPRMGVTHSMNLCSTRLLSARMPGNCIILAEITQLLPSVNPNYLGASVQSCSYRASFKMEDYDK